MHKENIIPKSILNDVLCSKCNSENNLNKKNIKINGSGVWFNCKICKEQNLIGWDIIKENKQLIKTI